MVSSILCCAEVSLNWALFWGKCSSFNPSNNVLLYHRLSSCTSMVVPWLRLSSSVLCLWSFAAFSMTSEQCQPAMSLAVGTPVRKDASNSALSHGLFAITLSSITFIALAERLGAGFALSVLLALYWSRSRIFWLLKSWGNYEWNAFLGPSTHVVQTWCHGTSRDFLLYPALVLSFGIDDALSLTNDSPEFSGSVTLSSFGCAFDFTIRWAFSYPSCHRYPSFMLQLFCLLDHHRYGGIEIPFYQTVNFYAIIWCQLFSVFDNGAPTYWVHVS